MKAFGVGETLRSPSTWDLSITISHQTSFFVLPLAKAHCSSFLLFSNWTTAPGIAQVAVRCLEYHLSRGTCFHFSMHARMVIELDQPSHDSQDVPSVQSRGKYN